MSAVIPIHGIIEQLSRHLTCCHTGTFLIATSDNRSCRLSLNAGRITHCAFGREHGDIALQKIVEIEQGSHSFVKGAQFPFRQRSEVKDKDTINLLIAKLTQQTTGLLASDTPSTLPSGLTDSQMERLFGKFHFE